MSGESTYKPSNGFARWMDSRLPIMRLVHDNITDYPTPKNINYWWTFGGILTFCLVTQIVTGIILAMHYTPNVDHAFNSVEHYAERELWLAHPLYPLKWCVDVLSRRLHSYFPRHVLRIL